MYDSVHYPLILHNPLQNPNHQLQRSAKQPAPAEHVVRICSRLSNSVI